MNRRTGPLSWLLGHIRFGAQMVWADLATIAAYYRDPEPLPRRQRTTTGWRAALPVEHPEFWSCLSTVEQQECAGISGHLWSSLSAAEQETWATIGELLGNLPPVPQPREESQ